MELPLSTKDFQSLLMKEERRQETRRRDRGEKRKRMVLCYNK